MRMKMRWLWVVKAVLGEHVMMRSSCSSWEKVSLWEIVEMRSCFLLYFSFWLAHLVLLGYIEYPLVHPRVHTLFRCF